MWKAVLVGTASLMLAGSSLVYAQQPSAAPAATAKPAVVKPAAKPAATSAAADEEARDAENMAAFAAAHIAALKVGLMLTPEQEKNWPALEQAMQEMTKLDAENTKAPPAAASGSTATTQPDDPVADIKTRADEMVAQATALKHLADAIAPLYASLNDHQKYRFQMLAPPVLSSHFGNGAENQQNADGGAPESPGYGQQAMNGPAPGPYGGPMAGPGQQGGYGAPMGPPMQNAYRGPMMPYGAQCGYGQMQPGEQNAQYGYGPNVAQSGAQQPMRFGGAPDAQDDDSDDEPGQQQAPAQPRAQ